MSEGKLFLVFGSQLFHPRHLRAYRDHTVYLAEHDSLCTYYRFHKQKIAFFLSAMRHYRDELREANYRVTYREITDTPTDRSYLQCLEDFVRRRNVSSIRFFEIEDKFMERAVIDWLKERKLDYQMLPNPQFLCSRQEFAQYLHSVQKPFMKTFYERQRRSRNILMDSHNRPMGGRYSWDQENRHKLPKNCTPPPPKPYEPDAIDEAVTTLVHERFPDHPGALESIWVPTRRGQAERWAKEFFQHRFESFGPYEDALTARSDFVYHSALSPLLNVGLLTPDQLVKGALKYHQERDVNLASVEGFLRQVMGWREFVRGIYRHFSERQESLNFFGNHRKLTNAWYEGTTGLPILDDAIRKAWRLGYNHHIERLMVLSNLMNLCEIHPHEAHRWFMEMYVDSSDWVMGPNVYGMSLFSDGGIFATKPYLCGSNYYRKMSNDYAKGDWCEIVDSLYWNFIHKHRDWFASNPRLSMMVRWLDKMNPSKLNRLIRVAKKFIASVTKTE